MIGSCTEPETSTAFGMGGRYSEAFRRCKIKEENDALYEYGEGNEMAQKHARAIVFALVDCSEEERLVKVREASARPLCVTVHGPTGM